MSFDVKNVIVDNVLTRNEIDQIYSNLKLSYRQYVMKKYGQQISDFWMPESALNKIVTHCENILGVSGLKLEAYQFSRYEKFTLEDGSISMPILTPHFDTFAEPRFTFDYQIKSNTSWPLVVEDDKFVLSDNQALTFSGTHQIHWREHKIFESGEFVDMIFCHLFLPGNESITEEHRNNMRNKEQEYIQKFNGVINE